LFGTAAEWQTILSEEPRPVTGVVFLGNHSEGVQMDREYVKADPDKAKGTVKDTAGKAAGDQTKVKFDKPLGSSHNDEADLRDVAREAAKKSQ
jgi:uncharacterized protein YjbJ (UPF0337 family)